MRYGLVSTVAVAAFSLSVAAFAQSTTGSQSSTGATGSSSGQTVVPQSGNTGSGSGTSTGSGTAGSSNTTVQGGASSSTNTTAGTTTQGNASTTGSINLSTEQQTQVSRAFSSVKVEPVNVSFNVTVGTVVPSTVTTLHTCPSEVVRLINGLPECRYIVVRDQIVIVEPSSRRIVTVIKRQG